MVCMARTQGEHTVPNAVVHHCTQLQHMYIFQSSSQGYACTFCFSTCSTAASHSLVKVLHDCTHKLACETPMEISFLAAKLPRAAAVLADQMALLLVDGATHC